MAVFHSLVSYIDLKKGILYRKNEKKNNFCNPLRSLLMKIDMTSSYVIRNPLRSLLMKIDMTSSYSSARELADDKSACFTQTLLSIFNLSGHS